MNKNNRPLSPFMLGSGYKLQATSVMSFLHRLSGIALIAVLLVVGAWIIAISISESAFYQINAILTHWLFLPILITGVFMGAYHFCNGIRHLFWDIGKGLEMETANKLGKIVQIASIIITLAIVTVGFLG